MFFNAFYLGEEPVLFCLSSCLNLAKGEMGFFVTCWVTFVVVTETGHTVGRHLNVVVKNIRKLTIAKTMCSKLHVPHVLVLETPSIVKLYGELYFIYLSCFREWRVLCCLHQDSPRTVSVL